MHTVTFELERDEEDIYVYADIFGYFLWATDLERVIGSVIPLAQHLFWKNDCIILEPAHELDIAKLLEGKAMVAFVERRCLEVPTFLVEGKWWTNPEGKHFFVPIENGEVSSKIMEKIKETAAPEVR